MSAFQLMSHYTFAYVVTFGEQKGGLDIPIWGVSSPPKFYWLCQINLALADSEHLGAAHRAYALGRWPAVFHGYTLSVLHFPLSATFYTISLHLKYLLFSFEA